MVRGTRFVLATGHPGATAAGLLVHARGGSLVDAGIAASAALCVLLPQATTLGGDLLALYRDGRTGRISALDAAGTAPGAATPAAFPQGLARRGARAAVVPGIVRGWQALHERHGRSAWADLLAPAADFAGQDYPLAPAVGEFVAECRADLERDPGCAALLAGPLCGEQRLRQPRLAAVLRTLASDGPQAFYEGAIGRALAAGMAEAGGLLAPADLAAYRVRWVEPLHGGFRGHDVHVMPPTSYGALLLLQLAALEAMPAGPAFERQLRAMQAAFAVGEPLLREGGDARAALATALKQISARVARPAPTPADAGGGTSCVVAGDADGNVLVMVQSIFNPFGAAFAEPATGIILNNRLSGFTAQHPVGPGRRPPHTLCPVIVTRDGAPRYAFASPGGISQTVTGTQFLCHVLDGGLDLEAAVNAPRWCLDRQHQVMLEPGYPDAAALGAGDPAIHVGTDPYAFGSLKAVAFGGDGQLAAAADSRRTATAFGY